MHPSDLAKRKTLIVWNEELDDIMKIVKSTEEAGSLIKCVSSKIENKAKENKGGFLGMFLGTLAACLLGNMSAGKRVVRSGDGV